ncbi:unnamed protein product, partial [Ixodes hexagonus]
DNDRGSDTCSESLLTAIEIVQDQQLPDVEVTPADTGAATGSTGSQTSTIPCSNSNDGSQTVHPEGLKETGDNKATDVVAIASTSGLQSTGDAPSVIESEAQSVDDFKLPSMPHIDFTQTESSERADSERSESFQDEKDQSVLSATGGGDEGMDGDASMTKEQQAFACAPTQSYPDTGGAVGETGDLEDADGNPDGREGALRRAPTQGSKARLDEKDDSFRNAPTQAYAQTEVSVEEDDDEACLDEKDDSFRNAPTQAYAQTEVSVEEDYDEASLDEKDDSFRNAPTQAYAQIEGAVEEDDGDEACSDARDDSFRNAPTQAYAQTEGVVEDSDDDGRACSDGKDDSFRNPPAQSYTQTEDAVEESDDNEKDNSLSKTVLPRLGTSTNRTLLLSADTEPADDYLVLCAASQADGKHTDDEEDFCAPTQMDAASPTPKASPANKGQSTPVSVNETPPPSPKSAIEETPPSSPSIVPESDPEEPDDSMVTARRSLSILETTGTSLFQDCDDYGDSEVILPVVGRSDKRKALLSSRKKSGGRTRNREMTHLKALKEEPDSVKGDLEGEPHSKQPRIAKKLEYADGASGASVDLLPVAVIPEEEATPGDTSRCNLVSGGTSFSIPGVAPLLQSPQVPSHVETEAVKNGRAVLNSTFTLGESYTSVASSALSEVADDGYRTPEVEDGEGGFWDARKQASSKPEADSGSTGLAMKSTKKNILSDTESTKEASLSPDIAPPPTRSRRSNAGARMKEFLSIEKRTAASGNYREDLASQEANKKEATPGATKEISNVESGTSKQKKHGRKGSKERTDDRLELEEPSVLPQSKEQSRAQPLVAAVQENVSAANPNVADVKSYQPFSRGVWDSQYQSTPYTSGTMDTCLSEPFPTFSQLM